MDLTPLILSVKLSAITAAVLLIIGLPLSALLAYRIFPGRALVEALITLPMVLPPTVIGFYLLVLFSPYSGLGHFLKDVFNLQLVYSFPGLVVASCLYSLPFMIEPLKTGMEKLPRVYIEASYTLGKGRLETFARVIMPAIRSSVISALVMTFAHTLGEFGVVLMVGGAMPGSTRLISIAIYENVEALNLREAHLYSLILLVISGVTLTLLHYLKRRTAKGEAHDQL